MIYDASSNGLAAHAARPAEWLPTDPPRIAPALMTDVEAAVYLRLTENERDIGDALRSLKNLVRTRRLRPCRVGKRNRYARHELDRFIAEQTEMYDAAAGAEEAEG